MGHYGMQPRTFQCFDYGFIELPVKMQGPGEWVGYIDFAYVVWD